MSVLGKLAFWKKDNDLGLGDELSLPKSGMPNDELGLNSPGMPETPSMPEPPIGSMPDMRQYQQQPRQSSPFQQSYPQYGQNRDMELISAKLDSLRATLDNINQRIANLERVAYGEDDRRRGW